MNIGEERRKGMIKLIGVNKFFGELHVLKNVNLEVGRGKVSDYRAFWIWKINNRPLYEFFRRADQWGSVHRWA